MKKYFVKTPWWLKQLYPSFTWDIKTDEKKLYLTFDDGPHPEITSFVLDQLKRHNAQATFFCIGKRVNDFPEIFNRIGAEGHAAGNHTFSHLNGWKVNTEDYLNDVAAAAACIRSDLFRPPYGRITAAQARKLKQAMGVAHPKVIMWDVLSADFDPGITPQQSQQYILKYARPGSIIVFHDSEKAYPRLKTVFPEILNFFEGKGFQFDRL